MKSAHGRVMVSNAEIARVMREIAVFLDMDGVPFKPRAYEKAAYAIDAVDEPIAEMFRRGGLKAIEEIPGVGKGIAEKIATLIETGTPAVLRRAARQDPGRPRRPHRDRGARSEEHQAPVRRARRPHGRRSRAGGARRPRFATLPHFGEKSEKKILKGIEFLKQRRGRFPLGHVLSAGDGDRGPTRHGGQRVRQVAIAGSIRRRKETVGDVDLLVVADETRRR